MRGAMDGDGTAAGTSRTPGHPPRVSVIVVSWNTRAALRRCLTAITGRAAEIIVVDNASGDGTAEMVAADFPDVSLVALPENLGFGAGVNRGACAARGEALLLLNPDTEPASGAIDALARHLGETPRCGAAGARLIGADGEPQGGFAVRRFPTLASWAIDLLLLDHVWPGNPITRRYLALDLDPEAAQTVDQPAAAALMVRRRAFDAIGGMDETFVPAWFEDVDLCRRLHDAGWDIAYVPAAVIRHEGGMAMRALGPRFQAIWHANMLRYARKHESAATVAALRVLIVVGMAMRIGVSALRFDIEDLRAYGRALAVGLRGR